MYQLKITAIGDSASVILPNGVLEKLGVGEGDILCLTETPDGFRITPYTKEFAEQMEAAEEVMLENHDALRKLAK
jgi:putative addiction module antidote